jgi:hypothetical protein
MSAPGSNTASVAVLCSYFFVASIAWLASGGGARPVGPAARPASFGSLWPFAALPADTIFRERLGRFGDGCTEAADAKSVLSFDTFSLVAEGPESLVGAPSGGCTDFSVVSSFIDVSLCGPFVSSA